MGLTGLNIAARGNGAAVEGGPSRETKREDEGPLLKFTDLKQVVMLSLHDSHQQKTTPLSLCKMR